MWLHATRTLIVGWEKKNFSDLNADVNNLLFAQSGEELFRF